MASQMAPGAVVDAQNGNEDVIDPKYRRGVRNTATHQLQMYNQEIN